MHTHVRTHAVVSEGMPSGQILRVVKRSQCDPIVLATYGRTRRLHAFPGSLTEDVLRQASYPIFTVRPPLHSPIRQRCADDT
jgi:nucleotide-binding universal stress UspA family protein